MALPSLSQLVAVQAAVLQQQEQDAGDLLISQKEIVQSETPAAAEQLELLNFQNRMVSSKL